MTGGPTVPAEVAAAAVRAEAHRFAYSCEPPVGPLLAALAAAVPAHGRILELGTGVGVGAAWLVSGLRFSGLRGSGLGGSGLGGSGLLVSGLGGSGLPGSGLPGSGLPGSGAHGSGLHGRSDVSLISVESSAETAEVARQGDWPSWVDIRVGDAEELLPSLGRFDLVFADAPGGKWTGLELTVEALRPGGVLVLDDMDLAKYPAEHVPTVAAISRTLLGDPRLAVVELAVGTGLLLATRRTTS